MVHTQQVIALCKEHGFALVGVCDAQKSKWSTEFEQWLQAEKHGEMKWLENNVELRVDPAEFVLGAESVVCVADRYATSEAEPVKLGHGKIARYARGQDYHKVMKKRLHKVCDALRELDETQKHIFRGCVDTAPLFEREFAANAGLGAIGKHTLLIDQGVGSWLMLGAIVTTAPLEPTNNSAAVDPCGSCTRCIDACPTDAITPWSVDATACISYLTIEHRSAIDPKWFSSIGDWIFGCDICQEVCPHNYQTEKTKATKINSAYESNRSFLDLLAVLNWTEDDRRDAFRGSAMKRARLNMIRRNAVIVARNQLSKCDDKELIEKIATISKDENESEIVRDAAKQFV
ncbi:tRNA epoxyqueuosine(34) reductase QueG [PVC group bacterium]|nr:tRNA epoxyqueuosine(34) reductase QueG [PVC group bacterium]